MTILLDSYYTIGKLHLFCEDYVAQGQQPIPYLILADGCSAAPDSDLGARLLVLNARRLLMRLTRAAGDKAQQIAWHWSVGRRIIRSAARQARALGVDEAVLDATLLIAWCDAETVYVHLYGDGCIALQRADRTVRAIQVEYAENAPYYLSYLLDAERIALYREAIGDPHTGQRIHYLNETGVTTCQEPFDAPSVFSFSLAAFPMVMVATDGIHSLLNVETGKRLDVLDVAQRLLDFQRLDSDFVKRQTREVLAEYSRDRVFNLDDLGLGAFIKID